MDLTSKIHCKSEQDPNSILHVYIEECLLLKDSKQNIKY